MALMVGNGAQAGAPPLRANRDHRQHQHGEDRPRRVRDPNLPQQPDGARGGDVCRVFLFGGWRLFTKPAAPAEVSQSDQAGARADEALVDIEPFESKHWLTLAVLAALVVSVIWFKTHGPGGADRRRDPVAAQCRQ